MGTGILAMKLSQYVPWAMPSGSVSRTWVENTLLSGHRQTETAVNLVQ